MKIEIDKNDFVKLAVYASCAYLPAEEELDLDENDGDVLRRIMKENNE